MHTAVRLSLLNTLFKHSFIMALEPVKELEGENKTEVVKTLEYKIFLYRKELKNSKSDFMTSSEIKLDLTSSLIQHNINNISKCSVDDLMNINEQLNYRKRLCFLRYKYKKMEQMDLNNINLKCIWDEI